MNAQAENHLAKAERYIGKGIEFYRKAVVEIEAAMKVDPMIGVRDVATRLKRDPSWVSSLLRWSRSGVDDPPFSEAAGKPNRDDSGFRAVLAKAPMEQVERGMMKLPPERLQQVAAIAGHAYHKARVQHDERERHLSPRERQEREAGKQQTRELAGALLQPLSVMAIEDHLDQAREDLNELVADHSVTTEGLEKIIRSWMAFTTELRVAAAMVDVDLDLEGALR